MQFRVFAALDKPKHFYYFNCDEEGEPYLDSVQEKDDFEKLHSEVFTIADKEYKKGNFVIGLGGDHSVSYGLMRAFSKHHKNAALIYFDAHLDCEDDFLPPTHEDIIRAAVNERFFAHKFILTNDLNNSLFCILYSSFLL